MDPTSSLIHHDDEKVMKSIADLPIELVRAVLEKVSTVELFQCRQICRQWKTIATEIIRRRNDVQLKFCFNKGAFVQIIQYQHCEPVVVNSCKPLFKNASKCLTDLVACMSSDFPYTNFSLDDLNEFANEDMQKFLSIWGGNIRVLKVNMKEPDKCASALREILFEKVTNLKKLELQFCNDDDYQKFDQRMPSSIKIADDSNELLQLPNLEVLCVNVRYSKFRGVVKQILGAARNLKIFEVCIESSSNPYFGAGFVHDDRIVNEAESVTSTDLAMLLSFNKLHCLKNLQLFVSEDIIAFWEKSKDAMDNLKLQSLAFSLEPSLWGNEQLKHVQRATLLLNHLFRSSKDVLETLSIEPLGSMPGLVIPVMKNLKKLDIGGFSQLDKKNVFMFPTSFEMADAFPNIKELDVHILEKDDYFPSTEPIKPMASVEVLRIYGGKSAECKEKLMRATPNVTTLLTVEDEFRWRDNQDVSIDFQKLSNYFPKLEFFGWHICRSIYRELFYKLDAAITGLPEKYCKELSAKFRNKDHLTADEASTYQLRREKASIVDSKALKKLDVSFFFDYDAYCDRVTIGRKVDEAGFKSNSKFFETGFTKVSNFLGFELMPDLKIRIHKRMD